MEDDEIILDEDVLEEGQEDEDTIDLDGILEDEEDEEEQDESTEEENIEDEEEQDDDTDEVDYKALYEAEQKKRKDLQNALNSERKSRKKSKEVSVANSETYKDLVSKGIDADIAEAIAKSVEKRSEETTSQIEDLKFEASIVKASKKPGFEDIEEYAEDIRPFVDKGLTIEQAYYVATGERGKTNTKAEVKRKIEAKLQNQKAKSKIKDVDTSGGSGDIKSAERYSSIDIQMAKAFGMSTKDYVNFKKINSEKDYEKMKSKK